MGSAERHAAVFGCARRRDDRSVRALLSRHAGGAALSRRLAGGGLRARAKAPDGLLRPQSGGAAGDAHDHRYRRAAGDVFLGRGHFGRRFHHGRLDHRHHVLSRRRSGAGLVGLDPADGRRDQLFPRQGAPDLPADSRAHRAHQRVSRRGDRRHGGDSALRSGREDVSRVRRPQRRPSRRISPLQHVRSGALLDGRSRGRGERRFAALVRRRRGAARRHRHRHPGRVQRVPAPLLRAAARI